MSYLKNLNYLMIFVVCVSASAQESIQVKSVYDFSGGLVNSLSNSLMQDNMATRLEDYDVTDIGSLTPRYGYRLYYTDPLPTKNASTLALFYAEDYSRNVFVLRQRDGSFGSGAVADTGSKWSLSLLKCDDRLMECSTLVVTPFYSPFRNTAVPYSATQAWLPIGSVFVSSYSEPQLLRRNRVVPLRQPMRGQLSAFPVSGGGKVSGTFRYMWTYEDRHISPSDTMRPGPPSFPVSVKSGKIILSGFPNVTDTTRQDRIIIWREENGDGKWRPNQYFTLTDNTFTATTPMIDSVPAGSISDTLKNPTAKRSSYPSGMTITASQAGTGVNMTGFVWTGTSADTLAPRIFNFSYAVIWRDSLGTLTWASAPSICIDSNGTGCPGLGCKDSVWSLRVDSIPSPTSTFIKNKILLRRVGVNGSLSPASDGTNLSGRWEILSNDMASATTSFVDTFDICFSRSCEHPWPFVSLDSKLWSETIGGQDSTLPFQPSVVASFNSRLFAAGDPVHPNYLYYSDFGRPSAWPQDHVISLVSTFGDWINGLYPLGDRLLIFRQNSIFQFAGANFYQFQLDEMANNVGLSGPRTLAGSQNEVFFAHKTGIYEVPRGGAMSSVPVSLGIQNSLDSASSYEHTAVGVVIGRDYWYCPAPDAIERSYVYTALPKPHWKVYRLAVKAAVPFDPDTSSVDYSARKYVLLSTRNRLWRWDYTDTTNGDVSGLGIVSQILPLYQSKYFFEGPSRTKIQYVDVEGTGETDSIRVSLVGRYGGTVVSRATVTSWATEKKTRLIFGSIVKNVAVRIETFGGRPVIKGYDIGYTPWDGGKL